MTRQMTTVDGQPGWVWRCDGPGCLKRTDDPHLSEWTSTITHGSLGDPSSTRDFHAPSCLLLAYGWTALATIFRNLSAGQLPASSIPIPVLYLIKDNERNAWWRADRNGYTTDVDEAGRYSEVEALHIAREAALGGDVGHAVALVVAPDAWMNKRPYGQGELPVTDAPS